jgi:hypothetical protein
MHTRLGCEKLFGWNFWCEFLSCASCPSWRSIAIMSSSYLTYRNTWSKCRQTDYILQKFWGTCQKNGTSAVISDDLKHLRCFYRLRMIDDYYSAATTQLFTPLHLNWGLYSGWNFLRTAGWVAPPLFDGLLNGTVEWPRQGHPKRLVCSCLQTASVAHPWKVIVASMLTLNPLLAANQTSEWNIRIRLAMMHVGEGLKAMSYGCNSTTNLYLYIEKQYWGVFGQHCRVSPSRKP